MVHSEAYICCLNIKKTLNTTYRKEDKQPITTKIKRQRITLKTIFTIHFCPFLFI